MPRQSNRVGCNNNVGSLNKKITTSTTFPTSPKKGDYHLDTSLPALYYYTGAAWSLAHSMIKNTTPSGSGDTGTAGEICYDSSYLYICTATDTWTRVALAW